MRDVTNQTLSGREKLDYSPPGGVWLVTSWLGTGKSLTLFYSVVQTQEDWDLGDEGGDEHLVAVAANHGHHRIRGPCGCPQHHVRYGHLKRRFLYEASLSTCMYILKK
jgi:hypothetical protein